MRHKRLDLLLSKDMRRQILHLLTLWTTLKHAHYFVINIVNRITKINRLIKTEDEYKTDRHFDPYIKAIEKYKTEPDPIKQREIYYSNNKLFHELYQTETYKDFRKRVKKGLKEIYDRPEKKILVVSHGATIIQSLQIMTGIDDYIHGNYKNGTNCHISYIKLYEKIEKNKIKRRTKIIKLL